MFDVPGSEPGPSRSAEHPQGIQRSDAHDEAGPSHPTAALPGELEQGIVKPAPTVVQASQHLTHTLPRRFLGPIPSQHVYNDQTEEKRAELQSLRRKAMRKMLGDNVMLGLPKTPRKGDQNPATHGERALHKFRVKRKSILAALDQDETFELPSEDSSDSLNGDSSTSGTNASETAQRIKKKRMKKKQNKKRSKSNLFSTEWIGDSFDIGREFDSTHGKGPDPAVSGADAMLEQDRKGRSLGTSSRAREKVREDLQELAREEGRSQDGHQSECSDDDVRPRITDSPDSIQMYDSPPEPKRHVAPSRKTSATASTAESFVTARTKPAAAAQISDDDSSHFTADLTPPRTRHAHAGSSIEASPQSSPLMKGSSAADSTRPLISDDEEEVRVTTEKGKVPQGRLFRKSPSKSSRPTTRRLKSALRTSFDRATREHAARDGRPPHKTVQFPEEPAHEIPTNDDSLVREGDQEPADPIAVLNREGVDIDGTSSGATTTALDDDDFMPGGVVMRDRALLKIGRQRSELIDVFDEEAERSSPCAYTDPMEQCLVALTMTSVDIYSNWRLPCVERYKGFKRLRFSIPLSARTGLNLFNQVDKSLCLTCPWTSIFRQTVKQINTVDKRSSTSAWDRLKHGSTAEQLGMERSGTGIFVLLFQEQSRALDWHWFIAGQLDQHLPRQIDIRIPALATSVRIPVPEDAPSLSINRKTLTKEMWDLILANSDRKNVLQALGHVPALEFAWQMGPQLDWIAYETTVTGKPRDWALLASFARCWDLKQTRTLQLRDASHYVTEVTLENGSRLKEPPSVEGFLTRKNSDVVRSQSLYVSVNDGYAFLAPAALADPPLIPKKAGSTPADLFPGVQREFLANERRRISRFIERCVAVLDLRDVEDVKLSKPRDRRPLLETEGQNTMSREPVQKQGETVDREFEVALRSGQVVRFEAYTPAVAEEWVTRLRILAQYWTTRRRVNARQEMDAIADVSVIDKLWTSPHLEQTLNRIWNWCVIDGCRAITLEGPLFMKKGKWPKFRQYLAVLTNGRLVTYRIKGSQKLMSRKHSYPLFGAYAYSGLMALDELQENNNQIAEYPKARIYEDGLQTTDDAEDTTMAIAITWPTGRWAAPQPWEVEGSPVAPPKDVLTKTPKLILCRARSKVSWNGNKDHGRPSHPHFWPLVWIDALQYAPTAFSCATPSAVLHWRQHILTLPA